MNFLIENGLLMNELVRLTIDLKYMIMRALIFTFILSVSVSFLRAQDINSIFNDQLIYDAQLSGQTKAVDALMKAYGTVETKIYKYEGSFEEAIENMKAPRNADVGSVNTQSLGSGFGAFIMMTENLNPKPMNDNWYENARRKADELIERSGKSLSMTISSHNMQQPENVKVGDKVEIRMISVSSPYVDLDNLKIVAGTWVSDMVASTIITREMMESESGDFEEESAEKPADMDVDLPSGVHLVRFDEVADTEFLQGDVNYVVEMSDDQVINFFKNSKGRFVNSFERSESYFEEGAMITNFYLLKHQGELKAGDDVVSLTIQTAPKSILSDVLGRNQGIWTLISISRWTEEDY